jgi:hypothetical protein
MLVRRMQYFLIYVDDAKARSVKFILDLKEYNKNTIVMEEFAQYQGPALLAYNSATFSERGKLVTEKCNE